MSASPSGVRALAPAPDEAAPYDSERAALLWTLARRAIRLAVLDPSALGGVVVHGRHGPARSALLAELAHHGTVRRIPPDVDVDALVGGVDTAATLASGRTVRRRGLLDAECGTVLLLAGAERLSLGAASAVAAWLERGADATAETTADRRPGHVEPNAPTGTRARVPLIVLDESVDGFSLVESALGERLALHVEVPELTLAALERALADEPTDAPDARPIASGAASPTILPDEVLDELVRMAARLDVPSARSGIQSCRAARTSARLAGRERVLPADAALAVQLVLAPRARRVPDEAAPPATPEEASGEDVPEEADGDDRAESEPTASTPEETTVDDELSPARPDPGDADTLEPSSEEPPDGVDALPERLVRAVVAALPRRLLDELVAEGRARGTAAGRDAAASAAEENAGRPIGTRRPRGNGRVRLNLPATLKAAIPYQRLRSAPAANEARLRVRREDFRVTRYRQPTRTTTVFVVDASGSAAMHRLAEAKGAVETLLAECYVRRDRVALITFRGHEATLDLPPTRSLVRARRALVGLPGGGGTPLAAGLDLAADVLERLAKGGESPVGVFMTDGRGNIARDGIPSREAARADAELAATRLARIGARLLFVDTAPRPRPDARNLAAAMRARYLPLPQLDATILGAGGAGGTAGVGARR